MSHIVPPSQDRFLSLQPGVIPEHHLDVAKRGEKILLVSILVAHGQHLKNITQGDCVKSSLIYYLNKKRSLHKIEKEENIAVQV